MTTCPWLERAGVIAWLLAALTPRLEAQPAPSAEHRIRPQLAAVRTTAVPTIDGHLDESDWDRAPLAGGFVQIEPQEGRPATERTLVRVLFDDDHLYFGVVCYDSEGASDLRVRDLRRDFDDTTDDFFGIAIDGIRDERSALVFRVNPLGALRDQQTVEGGLANVDFDAVWTARTSSNSEGWVAEIAIPWRTLRYRPEHAVWGINFQRVIRRKNEDSGWAPWPRMNAPYRMDMAGSLTGLEPPPPGRNVRLQPFAVGEARRGAAAAVGRQRDLQGNIGVDAKWAVSPSTVVDLTVRPDFGHADVDRQVVNLTRFSVFFPERRQFFLENRGLFATGYSQRFEPFYSRRIGLDDTGNPIPITAGGRLSMQGRTGAFGALFASQEGRDDTFRSHFGVVRYVANFGTQNRVGGLFTTRRDNDGHTNVVGGIDGYWRPSQRSFVRGTLTGSSTTGPDGEGLGGYIWAANEANWGYVGYLSELVTRGYDARSGFTLRNDYLWISPAVTLDWRPSWRPRAIRRLQPGFVLSHYVSPSSGSVQEGLLSLRPMTVQFENGGTVQYTLQPNWQRPTTSFKPIPGIDVGPGQYDYLRHSLVVQSDPSAKVAVRLEPATGGYFDGRLHALRALVQATPDPRMAVSADYTVNRLERVGIGRRSLTTQLLALELRLAANPRFQLVTFSQWNTAARQLSVNARLAWEYRPLAFVTVVYNDRSLVDGLGLDSQASSTSRQLLIKGTWLLQF